MAFGPNPPPIQVHLCVKGGEAAMAFYEKAIAATCTMKQLAKDKVRALHVNLAMPGGEVMPPDEFAEWNPDILAPLTHGGASMAVIINLPKPEDVDAALARAAKAGATITMPAAAQFRGARYGRVRDPFGHVWTFNAALAGR